MDGLVGALQRIGESAATLGLSRAVTFVALVPVLFVLLWLIAKLVKLYFLRLRRRAVTAVVQMPASLALAAAEAGKQAGGKALDVALAAAKGVAPTAQSVGSTLADRAVLAKDAAVRVAPVAVDAAARAVPAAAAAAGAAAGFVVGSAGTLASRIKEGYDAGHAAARRVPDQAATELSSDRNSNH